jgi:nicotinamidase-related amidase
MRWIIGIALFCTAAIAAADTPATLDVVARSRVGSRVPWEVVDPATGKQSAAVRTVVEAFDKKATLDPARTAVVVCDMWDDHWCKSAATRCADLARAAEPVLKACRDRGMTIIHCPSDTMEFYKDHPARKRMLALPKAQPPKAKDLPNPPLPVDDTDGGCDDEKPARQYRAWKRQHEAITIDEPRDYITDSGADVLNLMASKKLTTVLVMGVHTNMCVLNRTFAIKQLVKWGKEVYLVRDLTDAMYNPRMKPFVDHRRGADLIIEFIELNWCPSIESKSLLGAK